MIPSNPVPPRTSDWCWCGFYPDASECPTPGKCHKPLLAQPVVEPQTCANCTINGSVNCPTHRHNSPLLPGPLKNVNDACKALILAATAHGRAQMMAELQGGIDHLNATVDAGRRQLAEQDAEIMRLRALTEPHG